MRDVPRIRLGCMLDPLTFDIREAQHRLLEGDRLTAGNPAASDEVFRQRQQPSQRDMLVHERGADGTRFSERIENSPAIMLLHERMPEQLREMRRGVQEGHERDPSSAASPHAVAMVEASSPSFGTCVPQHCTTRHTSKEHGRVTRDDRDANGPIFARKPPKNTRRFSTRKKTHAAPCSRENCLQRRETAHVSTPVAPLPETAYRAAKTPEKNP